MSPSVQRSVLELRAAVRQARGDAVHVWTGHLSAVLGRLQATEREVAAIRRLHRRGQSPDALDRAGTPICVACGVPWPCPTRSAMGDPAR